MSDALEIDVDELEKNGIMRWWRRGLGSPRSRQFMEFGTTNLIRSLREMTKRRLTPLRVTFAHPHNARIKEFERFFGCSVEFGRRANLRWDQAQTKLVGKVGRDNASALLRAVGKVDETLRGAAR